MKKLLLPFMLGSFALPAVAMDYQTDDGFNLPELSADVFDAYNMEANANRRNNRRPNARPAPPRTRLTTAMEHTENRFDNGPKTQNTNFMIDGQTTFNDNYSVGYSVSERTITYREGDMDTNRGKRMNLNINPRYNRTVSPNLSWNTGFGLRRTLDVNDQEFEEQAYTIRGGFIYRMGQHSFNIKGHARYIENQNHKPDWMGRDRDRQYNKNYNFNPIYIYRLNNTTSLNLEASLAENDNPQKTWNRSIKGGVTHRWSNGIRTSLNYNLAKTGSRRSDNDKGNRNTNLTFNNNIPVAQNLDVIANLGWRTGEPYDDGDGENDVVGNGDRETLFIKLGVVTRF